MERLKHYFTLTAAVLLMLSLSMLAQAQLVGHWTFEPGSELKDLTGNFGNIELRGATVGNGYLNIGDNEWAITTGYSGPDIGPDKTLVAWLYLDDLDVRRGAPIGINQSSADTFDAIVYAERQERHWMAGSSFFGRTEDADPGFEETETGQLIEMVVSYEDDGGDAHIRIYRNGDLIGDYIKGVLPTWVAGDVEAIFGPRAYIGGTAHGWVIARVEDARIYNGVLTPDGITAVDPGGKLTTSWGAIKAKSSRF